MVGRHKSYQVTEEPKVIIYCLGGGDRPRHHCSSASWSVIIIIQMYIIQYSSFFRHIETIVHHQGINNKRGQKQLHYLRVFTKVVLLIEWEWMQCTQSATLAVLLPYVVVDPRKEINKCRSM